MSDSQEGRQAAVEAFAELATPDEKARVALVAQEIAPVVAQAQSVEVRTRAEAEAATEFLSAIARATRKAEEARKFLVGPLNAHVKAINERFKADREPLDQADRVVREKVIAFRREEERRRAEEQARLQREADAERRRYEEERRRQEAEARAARERAAREAVKAEAAARQAEADRQRQIAEQRDEERRRIAQMDTDELEHLVRSSSDGHGAAAEELEVRANARVAQERAAAAARAEEEARALEAVQKAAPLPDVVQAQVAPAGPVRAESGQASSTKRWDFEIVEAADVPLEFRKVDEQAIRAAVKAGCRKIPGVRIHQVDGLAVRAR